MNLIERFKAWRERRYWAARHLHHIRSVIMLDWRWLCVHPAGRILTDRYEKLTARDWYRHSLEDVGALRRRLGWDPHEAAPEHPVDNSDLRALLAKARLAARPTTANDGGIVYLEWEDLAQVEEHAWVNDAYYSKVPTSTNVAYRPVDPPINPDKPHQIVVEMDSDHWGVLLELAEKRGLSFSNLMVQALRAYQMEDRTGALAAHLQVQERHAQVMAGGGA